MKLILTLIFTLNINCCYNSTNTQWNNLLIGDWRGTYPNDYKEVYFNGTYSYLFSAAIGEIYPIYRYKVSDDKLIILNNGNNEIRGTRQLSGCKSKLNIISEAEVVTYYKIDENTYLLSDYVTEKIDRKTFLTAFKRRMNKYYKQYPQR